MAKLLSKSDPNKLRRSEPQNLKKYFLKICVWLLFLLVPVSIVVFAKIGAYKLFFSTNDHFNLKRISIEILKGNFSEDYVRSRIKINTEKYNIFSVNPGNLRSELLTDPLIQEVEVRRLLPNTLHLKIYGRTPMAQLINNDGKLIDSDGIILGDRLKKDLETWPIITGIQNVNSFRTGEILDNPLVLKAIHFLTFKEMIKNGHWLDVQLIQLNENDNELRIYLNAKGNTFIKNNAVLILPLENMERALTKTLEILNVRIQAHQPTSYIDATYQRKIPVRP